MTNTGYSGPKNFFPLPNEIFSLGLCSGEISVYSYLLFLEDRHSYTCYPSYATIGKAVGMCPNTVRKYVQQLEEKCLIYTEPTLLITPDGQPRNGNLKYTIRPIREALEHYYTRQMDALDAQLEKDRAAQRSWQRTRPSAPLKRLAQLLRPNGRNDPPDPMRPRLGQIQPPSEGTKKEAG